MSSRKNAGSEAEAISTVDVITQWRRGELNPHKHNDYFAAQNAPFFWIRWKPCRAKNQWMHQKMKSGAFCSMRKIGAKWASIISSATENWCKNNGTPPHLRGCSVVNCAPMRTPHWRLNMVAGAGFEPTTSGLWERERFSHNLACFPANCCGTMVCEVATCDDLTRNMIIFDHVGPLVVPFVKNHTQPCGFHQQELFTVI